MAEAHFTSPMAVEMAGNLAEKVPPNPQHVSASRISTNSRPWTCGEQTARLLFDLQFAQAVAAVVKGHFGRKSRPHVGHAELGDEKIGKLPGPVADGGGPGGERGVGEKIAVEDLEHRAAGAGADDDGIGAVAGELLDHRTGHLAGLIPIAGVECGLAAAKEVFVVLDRVSQPLENGDDAHARLGIHGVHEAGDEEGDFHVRAAEKRMDVAAETHPGGIRAILEEFKGARESLIWLNVA